MEEVKKQLFWGFLISLGIVAAARVFYQCFPHYPKYYLTFSAIILLWAVLGRVGWREQTFGGENKPERINQIVFFILSICGTFFLVIGILQS